MKTKSNHRTVKAEKNKSLFKLSSNKKDLDQLNDEIDSVKKSSLVDNTKLYYRFTF